jgi:Flp pilus assembly secretin CpaC
MRRFTMIAIVRACALSLLLFLTSTLHALAVDQTVILTLDEGSVLMLERPYETVLIGTPDVVDVHSRSDNSVFLEPLNLGASELIFMDERSIAIATVRVLVCRRLQTQYREGPDRD